MLRNSHPTWSVLAKKSCYGLNICVLAAKNNSCVENLTLNMMVLGGGAFGEGIRSWQQSPHEWDSCPYKRGLRVPWQASG